jgi:cyclin-dependent kinase
LAPNTVSEEILNPDGPTFGHYEFATFHKDGQMSTVFKAQDKSWIAPDRIVALKVTHPSTMVAPHDSKREARILVECHAATIVPLLESFGESGGRFVLAFPFLRQDLENLLRTDRLTGKQKQMVFQGLFEALAHIHSLGIIHRDVKPSNILLKSMDGPVYLTDFGIAWSPRDRASEPADSKITDVGTTSYRPPELLFGHKAYDTSLDMWAAGCVVGEMEKEGHHPIFDGGPLGSELGLIKSIFTTLGTPTDETWPVSGLLISWNLLNGHSLLHRTLTGTR